MANWNLRRVARPHGNGGVLRVQRPGLVHHHRDLRAHRPGAAEPPRAGLGELCARLLVDDLPRVRVHQRQDVEARALRVRRGQEDRAGDGPGGLRLGLRLVGLEVQVAAGQGQRGGQGGGERGDTADLRGRLPVHTAPPRGLWTAQSGRLTRTATPSPPSRGRGPPARRRGRRAARWPARRPRGSSPSAGGRRPRSRCRGWVR